MNIPLDSPLTQRFVERKFDPQEENEERTMREDRYPNVVLPLVVNAWLLIVLGWPFHFFEHDWVHLWGGTKAGIFIGNFVLFSFVSRLIVQAYLLPELLSFPWYLAFVLVFYPTIVVGYLAPEREATVAVIAFISGWPLSWSWLHYVSYRDPWLWECTRCGYRIASDTDEFPPTVVRRKRCNPTREWLERNAKSAQPERRAQQGEHKWTLVGPK